MREYKPSEAQPGTLTAYRVINLIDPETGDQVTVRIEAPLHRVDAAFVWVAAKLNRPSAG